MRTANPALNGDVFSNSIKSAQAHFGSGARAETMTVSGTVNKTGILLAVLFITAYFSWAQSMPGPFDEGFTPSPYLWAGAIIGFILAMVTIFKKEWSPITAPLYAAAEGLFLGGMSAMFELMYPGIVSQAVFATLGTLFALLAAYKSGLIKATENFKLGVVAATGGIFMLYMINMVMSFFGSGIGFIHDSGLMGIGFSAIVVVVAALNLVLDFDFIEKGEEQGAPIYMEWYAAFGLLVTLVWLYMEMLRLISKLQKRN